MLEFMLDTNICIFVLRGRMPGIASRFAELATQICISTITLAELHYGAEKSARQIENRRAVDQFVARIAVLSFSPSAAVHFGQIRTARERAGMPASSPDMLIGAHARSEGLTLVTNNRREFDRMPGLRIENWV